MNRMFVAAALGGTLMGLSQGAGASGFAIIEQGVSGLGTAFAGGSAIAEDATTVFFNPAGMTRLKGNLLTVGSHLVAPSAHKFSDGGSRSVLGLPMGANANDDAGKAGVVPNVYFVTDLGEKLKFGLGVNTPYALSTHYDRDWIGRYHAVESGVVAVNISPNLAWKAGNVAVGVGINAQYLKAKLSNAIDYGTIDAIAASGAFGLTPGASDGFGEISGDDTGWGWNLGTLIDLNDSTRLGIHYRSEIDYDLRGDADFDVPAAATLLAAGLGHVDTGASAELTTPDVLSISLFHQINDRWAVMGDLSRTGWESLEELRIRFDSGAADTVTTMNWENSWRYSLGVSYRHSDDWTWRAGIAHDQTPIPSAELRTPRIPGEDRTWLAFGFGYKVSDTFSIDMGYAHLWVDDPRINKVTALPTVDENTFRGSLVGEYQADVDILSAQLNWVF